MRRRMFCIESHPWAGYPRLDCLSNSSLLDLAIDAALIRRALRL